MKTVRVIQTASPKTLGVVSESDSGDMTHLGMIRYADSANPALELWGPVSIDLVHQILDAKWPASPTPKESRLSHAANLAIDLEAAKQRIRELEESAKK